MVMSNKLIQKIMDGLEAAKEARLASEAIEASLPPEKDYPVLAMPMVPSDEEDEDHQPSSADFTDMRLELVNKEYRQVCVIVGKDNNFPLLKLKRQPFWRLGLYETLTTNTFGPVEEVDYFRNFLMLDTREVNWLTPLGFPKVCQVSKVGKDARYKFQGLATTLYRYLVSQQNYILMSDYIQFYSGRKLWSRLSKMPELAVDVVDIRDGTPKFFERNVTIHQGKNKNDFDSRYYSKYPDWDKSGLLLILRPRNK